MSTFLTILGVLGSLSSIIGLILYFKDKHSDDNNKEKHNR